MNRIKKTSDTLSCPLCRDEICHAHIKKAVKSQYPQKDYPMDVNFDFMHRCVSDMILYAYQVINETNTWNTIQFYRVAAEKGYIHKLHSELKMIIDKIVSKYPLHTEKTIAYTMKQLYYIAQHGYQRFKQVYVSSKPAEPDM